MKTIVACIANFSDGKNQKVIDQIVSAIQAVSRVEVLQFSIAIVFALSIPFLPSG